MTVVFAHEGREGKGRKGKRKSGKKKQERKKEIERKIMSLLLSLGDFLIEDFFFFK
jgi:hypothetical protein